MLFENLRKSLNPLSSISSTLSFRCSFCCKPYFLFLARQTAVHNVYRSFVRSHGHRRYHKCASSFPRLLLPENCINNYRKMCESVEPDAVAESVQSPIASKKRKQTKTNARLSQVKKQTVSKLAQIHLQNPCLDIFDGIKYSDLLDSKFARSKDVLDSMSNSMKRKFINQGLSVDVLKSHLKSKTDVRFRIVNQLKPPPPYEMDQDEIPLKVEKADKNNGTGAVSRLRDRPPVVTILGHVDHGKTTLLDFFRKSNIAEGEHGGITQRIGAFNVQFPNRDLAVTFIDTPGHAAFDRMRERGTQCTDLVILIVASDDGIMKQTVECIDFINKYNTPFIIAITKIDKANSNVEAVESQFADFGIEIEKFGGSVPCVPISIYGGKSENTEELLDTIEALTEMIQPKCDPQSRTEGVIIEAKTDTDNNRKSASIIVKHGVLKSGQTLVCGKAILKVKHMTDENNKSVTQVEPGNVANVFGWKELPEPGDYALEFEEKRAREVVKKRDDYEKWVKEYKLAVEAEQRSEMEREDYVKRRLSSDFHFASYKLSSYKQHFEDVHKAKSETKMPNFNVFIRADNQGSLEAIMNVFTSFKSKYCTLSIVDTGVGVLSETELELAKSLGDALLLYFNLPSQKISNEEELLTGVDPKKKVLMVNEKVIYHLVDNFVELIQNNVPQVPVEVSLGEATVKQIFHQSRGSNKGYIAGCKVVKGSLDMKHKFKVLRNNEVLVSDVSVKSMKQMKQDVNVTESGRECGLMFHGGFSQFQPGDKIICYDFEMATPQLDWNPIF